MGSSASVPIVIYDGECDFCLNSINWLKLKLLVDARPFQTADLDALGLTETKCEKAVHVISDAGISSGAAAVGVLLGLRGNIFFRRILTLFDSIGERVYGWVVGHRDSLPVGLVSEWLKQRNNEQQGVTKRVVRL